MTPCVICVANQKGGVGKTTTSVSLAHGLALCGVRVLLVDLDPQGHVAFSLGLKKSPGLYRALVEDAPLAEVAQPARERLDILPGDKRTEKAKRYLMTVNFRERVLADLLAGCTYQVVILDTAPSLDVLHVAALVASDWVLIPTKLESMAVDGVNEALRSVGEVISQGRCLGYSILPTFYDRTTRETPLQLRELVRAFGAHVWPPIPQDTRAREAPAYGQTLWEYAPASPAAAGYAGEKGRLGGYTDTLKKVQELLYEHETARTPQHA